jgi:hypothetical protein
MCGYTMIYHLLQKSIDFAILAILAILRMSCSWIPGGFVTMGGCIQRPKRSAHARFRARAARKPVDGLALRSQTILFLHCRTSGHRDADVISRTGFPPNEAGRAGFPMIEARVVSGGLGA